MRDLRQEHKGLEVIGDFALAAAKRLHHRRLMAMAEAVALREDLTTFCGECRRCIMWFNARWPRHEVDLVMVHERQRN